MKDFRIGYSGTRYGMTQHQKERFCSFIVQYEPEFFHHGLCIGGDREAHVLVRNLVPHCIIIGHPPVNKSLMATDIQCDVLREPKDYLIRNHDIVDECQRFVAAPNGATEIRQSGTWATIRYARKMFEKKKLLSITVITP